MNAMACYLFTKNLESLHLKAAGAAMAVVAGLAAGYAA
jgi:hypothetical protein